MLTAVVELRLSHDCKRDSKEPKMESTAELYRSNGENKNSGNVSKSAQKCEQLVIFLLWPPLQCALPTARRNPDDMLPSADTKGATMSSYSE